MKNKKSFSDELLKFVIWALFLAVILVAIYFIFKFIFRYG